MCAASGRSLCQRERHSLKAQNARRSGTGGGVTITNIAGVVRPGANATEDRSRFTWIVRAKASCNVAPQCKTRPRRQRNAARHSSERHCFDRWRRNGRCCWPAAAQYRAGDYAGVVVSAARFPSGSPEFAAAMQLSGQTNVRLGNDEIAAIHFLHGPRCIRRYAVQFCSRCHCSTRRVRCSASPLASAALAVLRSAARTAG